MSTPVKLELEALMPARPCGYTADEQALIHRASGIAFAGSWLDPFLAFMGGVYAAGEAITAAVPNWGAVITSQNVSVIRRHPIDAPAVVHGRVKAFDANERGYSVVIALEAANTTGDPFAEMLMTLLLFDPAASLDRSRGPASGADFATPVTVDTIGTFSFTPEAVRCFEFDRPPSLHTNLDLARAAGFPKPIVAGNQVFSIIWNRFVSPNMEPPVAMNFTLRRPIFWDETITFERRCAEAPVLEILEVRNAVGKAAIVCEIWRDGSLANKAEA